ncbi:unnamed protein product [Prorocentrum cordatum]|uniref:Methyltransferase type 11 domain-containing protein n=1 Tax=Prorocentrum cordatum TaxID=2364126 RepID=A0ABN9PQI3_9DINO|nr:unnamed protein product [Polarella glacialis]
MHHGYYDDGSWRSLEEHKAAQVRMMEEMLVWAGVPKPGAQDAPESVLDVGCGVGGASRFLQRKFGASYVQGITLSPEQCRRARLMSEQAGQGSACRFDVADALNMPFPDNSFDLVWSLESGEHMPDKPQFMAEMARVCKPGGRVILVTWVHRTLGDGEVLSARERRLLARINRAYHLPEWCSIADYAQIAEGGLGMVGVRTTDWTEQIKPFWMAVILTALQPRGWWAMARGGLETLRGALVMPLMDRGYRTGTIKFGLLTGQKPSLPAGAADAAGGLGVRLPAASVASRAPGAVRVRRGLLCGAGAAAAVLRSPGRRCRASRRRALVLPLGASQLRALWDFTRPHTLVGTLISIPALHLFAAAPVLHAATPAARAVLGSQLASAVVVALLPAMLMNVYISVTGLNQIFDIDIDKQNKPHLPLASGRLSLPAAWTVVAIAATLAGGLAWCHMGQPGSETLMGILVSSFVLGTAYSAPPFRLKRSPFLAAFCIVVVRGLIVNLGFYSYASMASDLSPGVALDRRSLVAGAFFAIFGLVIALMKDVPDVLGDRSANIRSLSVRFGPDRVFGWAAALLAALLAGTSLALAAAGVACLVPPGRQPGTALARGAAAAAALACWRLLCTRWRGVDPQDPASRGSADSFYMLVWKVFYVSYLVLPLAL